MTPEEKQKIAEFVLNCFKELGWCKGEDSYYMSNHGSFHIRQDALPLPKVWLEPSNWLFTLIGILTVFSQSMLRPAISTL